MPDFRALIVKSGTTQGITTTDTLIVGDKLDSAALSTLTIGGTNATGITIGSGAITTSFPGPVELTGDVTTVGGTTFTSDATFEGNVTFGNGPADTVTFASTTRVVSDINFGGAPGTYKITNLANGTNPNDAVNFSQLSAIVSGVSAVTASAPLLSSGGATPNISIDTAGASAGNVLTYNGSAWVASPAVQAVFAGALTVYVDPVNGVDSPNGGTLSKPYASINYAYSQVTSLGAPGNSSYNAQVGQFVTEKLIFRLAPGRYTGDVTLGFKRARVQLIGDGVQIIGNVKMSAKLADFPASSLEALKSSFPAPWTNASAQMTFEITGEAGGGVEADTTADPFVVTGSTTLAFEEASYPGNATFPAASWEGNFGQFNFYANKANSIGGMLVATSYTLPTSNGLPTSVIEIDSCTIGEASSPVRTYLGAVPYAFVSTPSTWNLGTGVATGTPQSSTTLLDQSKSWAINQYAGATIVLTSGTGAGQTATVVSNTANTLTITPAWTTTPVSTSTTYSLIGTTNKAPTGTITLKCHNSTIGAAIGPRLVIGEIDGCRIYDIDRTMLGTVDNGAVTGSTSSSYIGMVINQFRVYGLTGSGSVPLGVAPSQYQLGSTTGGATRYRMDSTSYTTLAFSRSGGTLTARTLNLGTGVSFDFLDDSRSLAYTPTTPAQWLDPDPTTVGSALDKIAGTGLLAAAPTNGQIPIGNGTNFTPATISAGSGITVTNGAGTITIAATGGGTVTSVDVSGGTTGLTFSGGPIVGAGTITMAGTLDVDNGGTGATSLTGYVKGNGTSAFTASATIPGADVSGNISGNAANVTGVVAVGNGGTGQTTAAAAFGALSPLTTKGDVLGFDTANARIPVGTNGQVLTADSATALGVKWATPVTGLTVGSTAIASGAANRILFEGAGNVLQESTNLAWDDANQKMYVAGAPTLDTHTFNIGVVPSGPEINKPAFAIASGGRIHRYDGSEPANGEILIGNGSIGVKNFAKATIGAGTNIAVTNGAGTISIGLSGQVGVANGGTGQSTLSSGALVIGNGISPVSTLAPGSNGQVLTVVGGAWAASSLPAATDYSVVSITTAVSQGDAVTVSGTAAIATAAASARVAGMVSATANKVSVLGIIEDCNFEGSLTLAVGDAVYLSAANAGKLTNVAPSASGEVVAELGIIAVVNTVGGGAAAADVLWQPKSIVVL